MKDFNYYYNYYPTDKGDKGPNEKTFGVCSDYIKNYG